MPIYYTTIKFYCSIYVHINLLNFPFFLGDNKSLSINTDTCIYYLH